MSKLDFSNSGRTGITAVQDMKDPTGRRFVLPGTDIEWVRELHGDGGSEVAAHYNRRRVGDTGGRYTQADVGRIDNELAWREAFRNNPGALMATTNQPQVPQSNAPQAAKADPRAVVGAMQADPQGFWESVLNTNPGAVASLATPEQALDAWKQHQAAWNRGERNRGGVEDMFATPEFANLLTERVQPGNEGLGVEDWFWGIHSLFHKNPEGFQQWSQANPEMALRFHAQAGTGRYGDVSGGKGWGDFDWNKDKHRDYANALAYQKSQELGYGVDGKKDGRVVVGDYKTTDDVSSEGGWGDFWNLGTEQKLTDGLWNFIEENPVETALSVASLIAAPYAASALGSVAGGAMTGAVSGGALGNATGSGALKGALTGGLVGGAGGALSDLSNAALSYADPAGAARLASEMGAPVAAADAARSGIMSSLLNLPGSVQDYNEQGMDAYEAQIDANGQTQRHNELVAEHGSRPTNEDQSTWDRPYIGQTPVADIPGREWVYGPSDTSPDDHWHTRPRAQNSESGGGGTGGGGGGGSQSRSGTRGSDGVEQGGRHI